VIHAHLSFQVDEMDHVEVNEANRRQACVVSKDSELAQSLSSKPQNLNPTLNPKPLKLNPKT
jgi:hypothetical protein